MAIITLRGIEKVYRTKEIETTALENVNLEVEAGEFVSIMGPSGCGKSTLLNIIGLLDKPTKGTVSILGQECGTLTDTGLSHFRNANLGFVFHSFHLIPTLDVAANIELPLTYRNGVGASERRRRVEQVAQRLEMTHRLHHTPAQLSGGQWSKRVAIARAIVGRPDNIGRPNLPAISTARWSRGHETSSSSGTKETARSIIAVTHNEMHIPR